MNLKQLHSQAQQAINKGDYKLAHQCLVALLQRQPDHADSYFLLGVINSQIGQPEKAIALMEKAIGLHSTSEYLAHLGKMYALQGNLEKASEVVAAVSLEETNNALTLDTLGVALSKIGRHDSALAYFEKAIELKAKHPQFLYNYGVSLKFLGRFDDARAAFEAAIAAQPEHFQSHFALTDLGGISKEQNHVDRLHQVLKSSKHPDAKLHLCHALAKELEALGDHYSAFKRLELGKKAKLNIINYRFEEDQLLFDAAKSLPPIPDNHQGCDSQEPIFILGMPRSGTTLVERIISSHTEVTSAGELQDFGMAVKELTQTPSHRVLDPATLKATAKLNWRKLGERYIERTRVVTGETPRFIDKLPFNFFYLQQIHRALPNAKVICLMRNPMDTIVGNYRQLFSINNPHYAYAYDLLNTAKFYAQFYLLMQQHQHPNFYPLHYEKLVADPEKQIRNLLAFCQLPWQDACLHFEKNDAPVSTASNVQVRQPLNSRSIGRWRHYDDFTCDAEEHLEQLGIPLEF